MYRNLLPGNFSAKAFAASIRDALAAGVVKFLWFMQWIIPVGCNAPAPSQGRGTSPTGLITGTNAGAGTGELVCCFGLIG